jgi:UDP-3-O-[3-hydroxymyristoyl] N-acetylglucosamine deacetylase
VSGERIRLRPDAVVDTRRCTIVGEREARVATVEHLLAALHGILIDNVLIYVEGPELPALDGSSREWVAALEAAGIAEQDGEALGVTPVATFAVVNGRSCLAVEPSDRLRLTCVIHYDHPLLGTQAGTFAVSPLSFARELAAARTYGFHAEVESLIERGLALGGNPGNALVIFEDHYSTDLRYADECLRHKALDLLGDLYTGGRRFLGNVSAFMPGHTLNNDLMRLLHGLAPRQSDAGQDPKAGA